LKPDVEALLTAPKELLSVEHKSWLDLDDQHGRGVLAKALIAIANHGGGHVVVGIRESGAMRAPEERPAAIRPYTGETIAAIVKKFADPPIPNGPIQEFRPYIRKAGPSSEVPTSVAEWRALFDRCVRARQDEMLDAIRAIVQGSGALEGSVVSETEAQRTFVDGARARWTALAAQFPKGSSATLPTGRWSADFAFSGDFSKPDLHALRDRLEAASRIDHSGWPPFCLIHRAPMEPRPVDGQVEAFLAETADTSADNANYWRISPEGRAYTIQGYVEDARLAPKYHSGEVFDIVLHPRRLGEIALYASRMAHLFGAVSAVTLHARFDGLAGRRLVSEGNPRRFLAGDYRCHQDAWEGEVVFDPKSADASLPEIIDPLLRPLYTLFSFFELPARLAAEELADMRRYRF
jgi:hypothetical protein